MGLMQERLLVASDQFLYNVEVTHVPMTLKGVKWVAPLAKLRALARSKDACTLYFDVPSKKESVKDKVSSPLLKTRKNNPYSYAPFGTRTPPPAGAPGGQGLGHNGQGPFYIPEQGSVLPGGVERTRLFYVYACDFDVYQKRTRELCRGVTDTPVLPSDHSGAT